MFYTPTAILGPVGHLPKSNVLLMPKGNRSLRSEGRIVNYLDCEPRRHAVFVLVELVKQFWSAVERMTFVGTAMENREIYIFLNA